ncbi:unnamed protein product [Dibothriocephalus latus]|uniref:Uncharacterized protein n=1 Tax=Dibothriocephalus latus TaxID=60516 RepID=A0A3P7NU90_DIBLA|nr:unnamed protein product [Dibothriocephalus latus]
MNELRKVSEQVIEQPGGSDVCGTFQIETPATLSITEGDEGRGHIINEVLDEGACQFFLPIVDEAESRHTAKRGLFTFAADGDDRSLNPSSPSSKQLPSNEASKSANLTKTQHHPSPKKARTLIKRPEPVVDILRSVGHKGHPAREECTAPRRPDSIEVKLCSSTHLAQSVAATTRFALRSTVTSGALSGEIYSDRTVKSSASLAPGMEDSKVATLTRECNLEEAEWHQILLPPPSDPEFQFPPAHAVSCDLHAEDKVADSMQKLRSNKAPGEDGIYAEIYKSRIDSLAPRLHEVIGQAWPVEAVSDDWGAGIFVTAY